MVSSSSMVFNRDRDAADWLLVVLRRSSGIFSARRKRGAELIPYGTTREKKFMVNALSTG